MLTIDRLPLTPVPLGNTASLGKGDEVVSIGHSSGSPSPMTSGGQVKSLYPFDASHIIRTNARFSLGASGSPLFDTQGQLIGMITGQAFWELADDQKPFFMQVALPHLNNDWPRLNEISQQWIKAEPKSPEAWYELGTAQEGLGQTEEARKSYRMATMHRPAPCRCVVPIGCVCLKTRRPRGNPSGQPYAGTN